MNLVFFEMILDTRYWMLDFRMYYYYPICIFYIQALAISIQDRFNCVAVVRRRGNRVRGENQTIIYWDSITFKSLPLIL